jgi:hypothetical protein
MGWRDRERECVREREREREVTRERKEQARKREKEVRDKKKERRGMRERRAQGVQRGANGRCIFRPIILRRKERMGGKGMNEKTRERECDALERSGFKIHINFLYRRSFRDELDTSAADGEAIRLLLHHTDGTLYSQLILQYLTTSCLNIMPTAIV